MSNVSDANELISGAKCLATCGIPEDKLLAMWIALLAIQTGDSLNPATLISEAICINCGISPGARLPVVASLLCQIEGGGCSADSIAVSAAKYTFSIPESFWLPIAVIEAAGWSSTPTDNKSLVALADCLDCSLAGIEWGVAIYLLAKMAGASTNPNLLAINSAPFQYWPQSLLVAAIINLISQITPNPPDDSMKSQATTINNFTYYGFNGDTAITFPNLTTVSSGAVMDIENNNTLETFSLPVFPGDPSFLFELSGLTALTSVQLPLMAVGSNFVIQNCTSLASFSLPLAGTWNGIIQIFQNPSLTSIALPGLISNGDELDFSQNNLITFSLPVYTGPCYGLSLRNNPALSALSIPVMLFQDGGNTVDCSGCALNAASINQILSRGIASSLSSFAFILNGGTNAAPTGQGLLDKAALIAAGCSVTTN